MKTRRAHLLRLLIAIIIVSVILAVLAVAGYWLYSKIKPLTQPVNASQAERYFELGNEAQQLGDYKTASMYYKKALQGENKAEYLEKAAAVSYRLQQYDSAIDSYVKALQQKSNDAVMWNAVGNVQRDAGKAQDAIASYKKAIEVDKKYIIAYSNLINLYLLQSNQSEAKKILDQGLDNNPNNKDLLAIRKNIK